mmetsp:Transcript_6756/g.16214  ORF Transcript_6756/g.16214 Transcript_6756/m.16214 type:complete len:245 (+) Transcript_6756:166-900(+)
MSSSHRFQRNESRNPSNSGPTTTTTTTTRATTPRPDASRTDRLANRTPTTIEEQSKNKSKQNGRITATKRNETKHARESGIGQGWRHPSVLPTLSKQTKPQRYSKQHRDTIRAIKKLRHRHPHRTKEGQPRISMRFCLVRNGTVRFGSKRTTAKPEPPNSNNTGVLRLGPSLCRTKQTAQKQGAIEHGRETRADHWNCARSLFLGGGIASRRGTHPVSVELGALPDTGHKQASRWTRAHTHTQT